MGGTISSLEEAIQNCKKNLTSDLPPSKRAEHQYHLGKLYADLYQKRRSPSDLDLAIRHFLKSDGHLLDNYYHTQLSFNLGKALYQRFRAKGGLQDLTRAIEIFEDSVDEVTESDMSEAYDKLSSALAARYKLLKKVVDIEVSVELQRVAVTLAKHSIEPESNTRRALSNLGSRLRSRFKALGVVDDINQAISCLRKIVHSSPLPHSPPGVNVEARGGLGCAYFDRFKYDCSKGNAVNWYDWQSAVEHLSCAAGLNKYFPTGEKHLDLLKMNLTKVLMYTPPNLIGPPPTDYLNIRNVDLAITLLQQLAKQGNEPGTRGDAAMRWARFEHKRGHFSAALDGYTTAIEQLSHIGWNGLPRLPRSESAKRLLWLGTDTASCAIQLNRLEEAIEVSDHLRSLFWNGLSKFRLVPVDLWEKAPDLANELFSLAQQLEKASLERQLPGYLVSGSRPRITPNGDLRQSEAQADVYRQLTERRESCVERVRKVEGFQNFSKRRPFSDLRCAASTGPVVILIAGNFHSDALIVRMDGPVKRIPLKITGKDTSHLAVRLRTETLRRDWVLREVLATLWEKVCKPVLDELNPSPEQHIWWCPTGSLSFLPIHAAGDYSLRNNPILGNSVPRKVISSYTVSLGRLLDSRSKSVRSNSEVSRLLLVSKEEKPSYDKHFGSLPFVLKEMEAIKAVFGSQDESTSPLRLVKCLSNSESTVDAVLPTAQ